MGTYKHEWAHFVLDYNTSVVIVKYSEASDKGNIRILEGWVTFFRANMTKTSHVVHTISCTHYPCWGLSLL